MTQETLLSSPKISFTSKIALIMLLLITKKWPNCSIIIFLNKAITLEALVTFFPPTIGHPKTVLILDS